jgi:hypothetical protein
MENLTIASNYPDQENGYPTIDPCKKVLRLTLSKTYFAMTGEPDKMFEIRTPSRWIQSRLYQKDQKTGNVVKRSYDFVLLINGYGPNRPWKLCTFIGFFKSYHAINVQLSENLHYYAPINSYVIGLGRKVCEGNILN